MHTFVCIVLCVTTKAATSYKVAASIMREKSVRVYKNQKSE